MIVGDRPGFLETAITVLTAPVWGPIYLAYKGCCKLREVRKNDPHVKVEEPKPQMWLPKTELERVVFAALIAAGRPVTNAEFARLMGVSPAEGSKRISELAHLLEQGVIQKQRVGREVRLSLPHYH